MTVAEFRSEIRKSKSIKLNEFINYSYGIFCILCSIGISIGLVLKLIKWNESSSSFFQIIPFIFFTIIFGVLGYQFIKVTLKRFTVIEIKTERSQEETYKLIKKHIGRILFKESLSDYIKITTISGRSIFTDIQIDVIIRIEEKKVLLTVDPEYASTVTGIAIDFGVVKKYRKILQQSLEKELKQMHQNNRC